MPDKLIRINSRIKSDHHKMVKSMAKKRKISEGQLYREIIQYYFDAVKFND